MATSIGAVSPSATASQAEAPATRNNTIDQEDFIKLFLSQLQFQDPLEPVDNREFLAQLAQFSNLEQTRLTAKNTEGLIVMEASARALGLLERRVDAIGDGGVRISGKVTSVTFDEKQGPLLSILPDTGPAQTGIPLANVAIVTP